MRNKISIVFLVSAFLSAFPAPVESQIVINIPPEARNVSISGTPRVGQVLTGNYTYFDAPPFRDPEGASTFRWRRIIRVGNTFVVVPIAGATAKTYTLVAADEGARITFQVTPVALSGPSPGSTASATVGPVPTNAAPTASNVSISGTPRVGQVLTGDYTYFDANADPEGASTFRWVRVVSGALGILPIAGATAKTYTLVAADEGRRIRFQVTPVALSGASPGMPGISAAVGPVIPPPPNVEPTASNVSISGTPQVAQVLTGNYIYDDAERDLEGASTFGWLRSTDQSGTLLLPFLPIAGATAKTYTLVAADEGRRIRFQVRPVAQSGASPGTTVTSAAVGPVVAAPINLPPTANNVLISGTPRVGRVLTGSYTYDDAERDSQGASTFRWLRDNVAIAGARARSYALVAADEGTLIRFEITPVAQSGTSPGLAVTSAEVGPVTPAPNDRQTASDLELISLKATPELLTVNGQLTYTITVRNNGTAAATGVHVIDALPPGATPVPAGRPASSSQGRCTGTLTVDCDLVTLAANAEATVTINVMPTVAGDLINTAHVDAFEHDPILGNNSSAQTTTVRPPDPAEADLAITAAVGLRASGHGFRYTLTVTNHGPAMATGVRLTNDLPQGLDQITASQGDCSGPDPVLCALGELEIGREATVTIDVRTGMDTDTLPNRAAVNGDQHDPNTENNFALTSALELPTRQTTCDSKRCRLKFTCNLSDLLGGICDNQITLLVDRRVRRSSDERAARPRRVPFAAAISNFPGGQTENVPLKLTRKGRKLASMLVKQGRKKLKGVIEISNAPGGIDIIPISVRLK